MKSLDKAFDIIELVCHMDGKPVTPTIVANKLDLNVATCMRSMKYFCERGYLEQVSRKDGYVAGPASLTFADRQSKYSKIIDASEEPIRTLADELNNFINISVLYKSMRYLLYMYSTHTKKQSGAKRISFDYEVATSRLLLAACSEKDCDDIIETAGMPGEKWDNIDNREALLKKLNQIKENTCISFFDQEINKWIIGGIIKADGYPPAAIGFGISADANPKEAIKLTEKTVKRIENNLNSPKILF